MRTGAALGGGLDPVPEQPKRALHRLARRADVLRAFFAVSPAPQNMCLALGAYAHEVGIAWRSHRLLPLFSGSATNVSQPPAR
ncbi:MAG: hypothetical protein ACTHOI_02610 [Sphingomicrobium sp.]